jgi:hypothetical protein
MVPRPFHGRKDFFTSFSSPSTTRYTKFREEDKTAVCWGVIHLLLASQFERQEDDVQVLTWLTEQKIIPCVSSKQRVSNGYLLLNQYCALFLSNSHTHLHIYKHTHSPTHCVAHLRILSQHTSSPTQYHSLTYPHSLPHTVSLTFASSPNTPAHLHSITPSLAHTLSHTLCCSPSHPLPTHQLTYTVSLPHLPTLSLPHTVSLTFASSPNTPAHLHSITPSLTHTLSPTHCVAHLRIAETLGSWVRIPLQAWMSVCVFSVFMLSCVHVAALRRADPPSKESYRLCKKIKKLKKRPRSNKGLYSHGQIVKHNVVTCTVVKNT